MIGMKKTEEYKWHTYSLEQLFSLVESSEEGLTEEAAARIRAQVGANILHERGKKPGWVLFFLQFKDVMILTLIGAAIVSGIAGDLKDTVVILIIVLLNAIVGFVQEYRAGKAMEALKKLTSTKAKLIRQGVSRRVPESELVPGDIILLEAGDQVPADSRLVEIHSLRVDESSLTGEAYPIEKSVNLLSDPSLPFSDQYNMVFKGTSVSYGRAKALVVSTGMNTAIGHIAKLLQGEDSVTPLQLRLTQFSKRLSVVVLAICVFIFISGYLRGEDPLRMLLTAISVAVAAIPEALPAVITIALAIGAKKLVTKNALVRKLHAVETLGSVTYVCSDKTGTLTQNKMRVVESLSFNPTQRSIYPPFTNEELLLVSITLNQDTEENADGALMGDPTEIALYSFATEQLRFDSTWMERFERINEIPFDSERKLMTTIHEIENGGRLVIVKGALESLTEICINTEEVNEAKKTADQWSGHGQRVLAYACKLLKLEQLESVLNYESRLSLLGIVGMIDPPREEAKQAVADCIKAGIRPVMITGDHPLTARAIASDIGILSSKQDRMLTGAELRALSDGEFMDQVQNIKVYARVSPDQKLKIVKALQLSGEFVAMTGDGVNDAPALKMANIGIAMGITGTDVSKEAAHMILLDDNFATIVKAVKEGRRIFDNIRKFIKYVLTCNAAEIWTILIAPMIGLPIPLLPIHLLWINLVTDGLPGLALSNEKAEADIMKIPPRRPGESIFAHGLGFHVLWVGVLMGAITLGVQAWAITSGDSHWQTMVFCTLCFSQMAHVLAIRSDRHSLFEKGFFSNIPLLGAVLLTFVLQLLIVYVPSLQLIFSTAPLSSTELLICIGSASIILVAVETEKIVKRVILFSGTKKVIAE